MGALTRHTVAEIGALVAGEPEWWGELKARVVEVGYQAVLDERDQRGWTAGAILLWITGDLERFREYEDALRVYAAHRLHGTSAIVDAGPAAGEDVTRDALRVKQAFNYAEKVAPERWGPRKHHTHEAVGDLGERLRRARERIINPNAEDAKIIEASNQAGLLADAHMAAGSAELSEDEL